MSENAFHIIIKDHAYLPSRQQQEQAYAFFEVLVPESEWSYEESHQQPVLVGSDYSDIKCIKCHTVLSVWDSGPASDWWNQLNETDAFSSADTTLVNMPCCQQTLPLADVLLIAGDEPAAGFTRFQLSALEPSGSSDFWQLEEDEPEEDDEDTEALYYGTQLKPEAVQRIEALLGSSVLCIWERK